MIVAIWVIFAVLFVLWTASMWIAASLARWTAGALAAGSQPEPFLIQDALGPAAPEWLTLWLGPMLLELVQGGYTWATAAFETLLPWAGTAIGWMVPLIWAVWFVVAASMLAFAVLAHFLARRAGRLTIAHRPAGVGTF